MVESHLILCGGTRVGAAPRSWRGAEQVPLAIGGGEDVHLEVRQLTSRMRAGVTDAAVDLLEIASYVFAADQAVTRGGTHSFDYGDRWHRQFRFEIPVRCPEVWNRPEIHHALATVLGFLTDDEYEFGFRPCVDLPRSDRYLLDVVPPTGQEYDEVMLFSGGLDSLCGAVEEILVQKHRVVLVSHRSSTRVQARQESLLGALRQRVKQPQRLPLHVPVTVNKGENLNRDFNQRSRSFVFSAIAAVIARQVGLKRIRFYENGVTSFNLPVSPELIGARASRTTHPQSLAGFGHLFSLLFETSFEVQNPFQWQTKAQIVQRLHERGHADLCAQTCSCGHIWGQEEQYPHCGECSQCVERRISVLAAGLADTADPISRYASDPLLGERTGPALTYAERYVGTAREIDRLETPEAFAIRFPEVNDAFPYCGVTPEAAARLVHGLYRLHATGVARAIHCAFNAEFPDLFRQTIPARSLLGVTLGRAQPPQSAPPHRNGTPPERGFIVDRDHFRVLFDGRPCPLGNTLEFRLLERLHQSRGAYLSIEVIGDEVWGNSSVRNNNVQRVVSSIRRHLRMAGINGVILDGEEDGHYRLVLPPGQSTNISEISAPRPASHQG